MYHLSPVLGQAAEREVLLAAGRPSTSLLHSCGSATYNTSTEDLLVVRVYRSVQVSEMCRVELWDGMYGGA